MNALVRLRRQRMREREVLECAKENRWGISVFWLQDPLTRWAALKRLEDRGVVRVDILGYPMYRVTILNKGERHGQKRKGRRPAAA